MAVHATHAPIQVNFGPMVFAKAPTGPLRTLFPIPNSRMRSGIDQRSRKHAHATRKLPPPLEAAMRGKRQMFPVPTAMPSIASSMPQREVNTSDLDAISFSPVFRAVMPPAPPWCGIPGAQGARRSRR